jgi:16S rRNA (uracil1498-N3)-methyltransferase
VGGNESLPRPAGGLIIPPVARRIHVRDLRSGDILLDPAQTHHARHVLRLTEGQPVEAFDDAGNVAAGVIVFDGGAVLVRVGAVDVVDPDAAVIRLAVAAAVPKADRADWMVEKLSELGVAEFVPLAAERSVVLPEGRNKRERWVRIATEAAKQSRRAGVMTIGELTPLARALERAAAEAGTVWFLSTEAPAPVPLPEAVRSLPPGARVTAFVGPEGGWTDREVAHFASAGAAAVGLTQTVLRVETAAVATAAVVGALLSPWRGRASSP